MSADHYVMTSRAGRWLSDRDYVGLRQQSHYRDWRRTVDCLRNGHQRSGVVQSVEASEMLDDVGVRQYSARSTCPMRVSLS